MRLFPGEGFAKVLSGRLGRRGRGDTDVDHFPSSVAQDDEHEEDLEGECGDNKSNDGGRAREVV